MERIRSQYNSLAAIIFALLIIAAHLVAPATYDMVKNTISDLGSQGYEYKAIMQTGFILFGVILMMGISLNEISLRTMPLLIYALLVALSGIFCARPILNEEALISSEMQSILHPIFAQAAGVAFSIGILLQIFYAESKKRKTIHFLFLIAVIGLSIAFGLNHEFPGIIQRVLYLVSLLWLAVFYKP
ncbi:MAG: DUF998 domain-containing protein [Chitinophagaceae bacterium]|nr:DUF998 domain-containing protein [Chitinophagaceae bacterium]